MNSHLSSEAKALLEEVRRVTADDDFAVRSSSIERGLFGVERALMEKAPSRVSFTHGSMVTLGGLVVAATVCVGAALHWMTDRSPQESRTPASALGASALAPRLQKMGTVPRTSALPASMAIDRRVHRVSSETPVVTEAGAQAPAELMLQRGNVGMESRLIKSARAALESGDFQMARRELEAYGRLPEPRYLVTEFRVVSAVFHCRSDDMKRFHREIEELRRLSVPAAESAAARCAAAEY